MMKIACLPGFGKSTRTCHLPSAVVTVKVHGVVESHLPLTWRLAASIAPSLSRAAAHGAQKATKQATPTARHIAPVIFMSPWLRAAFFSEASEEPRSRPAPTVDAWPYGR